MISLVLLHNNMYIEIVYDSIIYSTLNFFSHQLISFFVYDSIIYSTLSIEDVIPHASLRGACWSRDGFSSHRGRYVNVILFQFRSCIWMVCKVFHRCMECNIILRGSLWMVRRGRDYEVMCLHSLEPLKFL